MKRVVLPYLLQIAPFAPMGAAAAIVAWQAQGGGFTAGGLIVAGLLCLVAYALIELPYHVDLGIKKGPRSCGNTNRGRTAQKRCKNHDYYTIRKPI